MAKRLTTFSKFLITLLVVAGVYFGFTQLQKSGVLGGGSDSGSTGSTGSTSSNSGSNLSGDDVIRIGVVTWGGYAGGQYFNEGFEANTKSRFYEDYGLKVEFVLNDDVDNSLNAWKNGDLDLHWYTIDAFPTIVNGLKDFNPVVVWQADWSRGGDAIVARRGIRSVEDLRGKKIAVAQLTPSHSFLLWLLDAGGLTVDDVQLVEVGNAIDAASAFKSQQVDAAVVWSPDDEECLKAVTGSTVLESTKSASNIIADIFFAKEEFVRNNRDKLEKLYEGWMRGAAEINNSQTSKNKAIDILTSGLGVPREFAETAINNVRLVTHGDNENFFGLNPDFKGVTGENLYLRMAKEYQKLGLTEANIPSWRQISYPQFVQQANLTGENNAAEATKEFSTVSDNEGAEKEAIATKRVSINFRTGEYQLDENAKYIIDLEFVDIAKAFGNARIRIEGNTDNVGNRASNVRLSKQRAQSVADYLVSEHGMDPNRFIIIGNGPDDPVADNTTDAGKAKNRRTDFELVRE
ncbi:MAG: phosphate ABC transporter substrate-binding/OmpA family protein [Saprospiraceae bacterium]|nr:OmpA family protein [Lewinella sp.]